MARSLDTKSDGPPERILPHGLGAIVRVNMANSTDSELTDHSFFDEVGRIASTDYIPIEADVLRARTKTTGIYETRFTMGQLSIQ